MLKKTLIALCCVFLILALFTQNLLWFIPLILTTPILMIVEQNENKLKKIQNHSKKDTKPSSATPVASQNSSFQEASDFVNDILPVLQKPMYSEQRKRFARAQSGECTPLNISKEIMSGLFSGYHGTYITTLEACECKDFAARKLPCKHMYRLAIELGKIDAAAENDRSMIKYPTDKHYALVRAVELLEKRPEFLKVACEIMYCHKSHKNYVCLDISEIQYLIDNKMVFVTKDPVAALTKAGQRKTIHALTDMNYIFPDTLRLQKEKYLWCLENADAICNIIFPNHGIIKIDEYLSSSFQKIYMYLLHRNRVTMFYSTGDSSEYTTLSGVNRDVGALLCQYDEEYRSLYGSDFM